MFVFMLANVAHGSLPTVFSTLVNKAGGMPTAGSWAKQERQKANVKDKEPTGQFHEGEPISLDSGDFAGTPNLYAYVRQNPWSKFDPSGLFDPGTIMEQGMEAWRATGPNPYGKAVAGAVVVAGVVAGVGYAILNNDGGHKGVGGGRYTPPGMVDCVTGVSNARPGPPRLNPEFMRILNLEPPQNSTQRNDEEKPALATASGGAMSRNGRNSVWNSGGTRKDTQSPEGKTAKDIAGETVLYIGQDGYIGITNDLDRRTTEWAREGRSIRELTRTPDRETARGVEQILIEEGRAKGNNTIFHN